MLKRRFLITGADSLIGSRILEQLLAYVVSVRAVVGSHDQVCLLRQQYPAAYYPHLEFSIVPGSRHSTRGAFDDSLCDHPEPFDTIIHAATNRSEEADCLARLVNLQTEGLLNLLDSIHRLNRMVCRVVIVTSLSPFARWLVEPESNPCGPYQPAANGSSEVDPEYILATSQASDNIVYSAIWTWMREARARFELAYVTTPSVYGPQMRSLENSSDLQEANRRIWNICSNDSLEHITSAPYGIDYYTDVRDLAVGAVQASFVPYAGNRRFTISAGRMLPGCAIAQVLANHFPEFTGRVRSDGSSLHRSVPSRSPVELSDTDLASSILGLVRYRDIHDTLVDVAQQIVELQRRKNWRRIIQS